MNTVEPASQPPSATLRVGRGSELRTAGRATQAAAAFDAALFLETLFASFIFDLSCSHRLCVLVPSLAPS